MLLKIGLDDVLLVILPDAHDVGDAMTIEKIELRFFGSRVRPQEQSGQDLLHGTAAVVRPLGGLGRHSKKKKLQNEILEDVYVCTVYHINGQLTRIAVQPPSVFP